MTRRCSHCSNNGHNSRTCPSRGGLKLFGVRLTDGSSMKKSASMGNLSSAHHHSFSSSPNPGSPSSDLLRDPTHLAEGYASDDPAHASCSSNCRGIPWTEEEHRMFLVGLQKLGKGDWRGIARNFVVSRSPTQVASHAQKYFIRQSNTSRRKRRSSLFDMVPDMTNESLPALEEQFLRPSFQASETENTNPSPPLNLSLNLECKPMESTSDDTPIEPEEHIACSSFPPMLPAFFPAYLPIPPYPFWHPNQTHAGKEVETHKVLKPTPVLSKDPVNVDELVGLSKLSLAEPVAGRIEPSALSVKLLGAPLSRQSAFHANPPVGGSDISQSNGNAIHAV
ncbi:transcription factor MYBS3-like isoform X2 [Magnolia sinica]|uniref:transcription factor MYBS3-like isoform X2 n=1 Tax=Magnolia sinica TaxID=86752 RepID=UPI0026581D34|nr:transcription factor MYBS3-like isoform X2 [Magnolia sinica]